MFERSKVSSLRSQIDFATEPGKPCYALLWEGALGDFFEIDAQLEVHHLGQVMKTPGNKYAFLYSLADPTFSIPRGQMRFGDPGKLMSLCAYGESGKPTAEEWELIDPLLNHPSILSLAKDDLRDSTVLQYWHSLARLHATGEAFIR